MPLTILGFYLAGYFAVNRSKQIFSAARSPPWVI